MTADANRERLDEPCVERYVMNTGLNPLEALLAAAAEQGAIKALQTIGWKPPTERVTRDNCTEFGAPSWQWIERSGIDIRGPRGGRYVTRVDLDAALYVSGIKRRRSFDDDGGDVADDAKAHVLAIVEGVSK